MYIYFFYTCALLRVCSCLFAELVIIYIFMLNSDISECISPFSSSVLLHVLVLIHIKAFHRIKFYWWTDILSICNIHV